MEIEFEEPSLRDIRAALYHHGVRDAVNAAGEREQFRRFRTIVEARWERSIKEGCVYLDLSPWEFEWIRRALAILLDEPYRYNAEYVPELIDYLNSHALTVWVEDSISST
jgi:hypothetical protein